MDFNFSPQIIVFPKTRAISDIIQTLAINNESLQNSHYIQNSFIVLIDFKIAKAYRAQFIILK